jgi:hypothetical protein
MNKQTKKAEKLLMHAYEELDKENNLSYQVSERDVELFEDKLKKVPESFFSRIKSVWKAFTALMAGFFTIGFIVARVTIPSETAIQTASLTPELNENYNFFDNGPLRLASSPIETQSVGKTLFVSPDQYDFKAFDNNGDGELSLEEAQAIKKSLAINQFEFSDINENGKLNYKESMQAVYAMTQKQFNNLDKNGDSHLSFEEVEDDIAHMDELQFNKLDRDQSGKLNYAEAQYMFVMIYIEG